jgi:hypothetical protein
MTTHDFILALFYAVDEERLQSPYRYVPGTPDRVTRSP